MAQFVEHLGAKKWRLRRVVQQVHADEAEKGFAEDVSHGAGRRFSGPSLSGPIVSGALTAIKWADGATSKNNAPGMLRRTSPPHMRHEIEIR
jgi:hypothetical protein